MVSAEQQARDMLERHGHPRAQELSAGDVVELANLINNVSRFKVGVAYMPVPRCESCRHWGGFDDGLRKVCTEPTISPQQQDEFMTLPDFGCVLWEKKP